MDADMLEFCLGDGRRLAWRSRQPAGLLREADQAIPATRLLGAAMADRLASSAPRALNIQFGPALDGIAWEALSLGATCLGEHFAVARQLISDAESMPAPATPLAEALALTVVYGAVPRACPQAVRVALDTLALPQAVRPCAWPMYWCWTV